MKGFVLDFPSDKLDGNFSPYQSRARELIVGDGFIQWGAWGVVPLQDRQAVWNELHDIRPCCSKMKALAGCYIRWLKKDSVIEEMGTVTFEYIVLKYVGIFV